jgi:hypothetical protein
MLRKVGYEENKTNKLWAQKEIVDNTVTCCNYSLNELNVDYY